MVQCVLFTMNRYDVQFTDRGLFPLRFTNQTEEQVAAALAEQRVKKDYCTAWVFLDGEVVQVFDREVGCDEWTANYHDCPLAHLGYAPPSTVGT
jgi:hypothetical protein